MTWTFVAYWYRSGYIFPFFFLKVKLLIRKAISSCNRNLFPSRVSGLLCYLLLKRYQSLNDQESAWQALNCEMTLAECWGVCICQEKRVHLWKEWIVSLGMSICGENADFLESSVLHMSKEECFGTSLDSSKENGCLVPSRPWKIPNPVCR